MALETLGVVAAILTTVAFVPQVFRTLTTRNTHGISLPMYATFCCGLVCWIVYGIGLRNVPIMIANVSALLLAGSVLVFKLRYG